ncbi:Ankyrin repeats (3 copies) [Legionella wadsworthii]|uniref:Ankyrin repeats (3 copies) n=1 Tax=Legionella wadsworthii TaxID=28088 RepID=A0A378LV87_9GAMM|nr:ankyrin repeat domain-containing protein [Legionella wadsworthii]STY31472.1 Ankyrin repeats (3 copies) [Legionella wadsworthii]
MRSFLTSTPSNSIFKLIQNNKFMESKQDKKEKSVEKLIYESKEELAKKDEYGNTPLHALLLKLHTDLEPGTDLANDCIQCISLLILNKNADTTVKNQEGKSALDLMGVAFIGSDFTLYKELIDKLSANSDYKKALFHSAIYANNLELVQYLLKDDKDQLIASKDRRGLSPYAIALAASSADVEAFFYDNYPNDIKETTLKLEPEQHSAPSIIKAAITYEDESLRPTIEKVIDDLYNTPEFRPVLNLIAAEALRERTADVKSPRIFVANSDNIANLTPKSKAFGDSDYRTNILRIGGKRAEIEIAGTFIHEITHLAAELAYGNNTKPYPRGSENQEQLYNTAIQELIAIDLTHPRFSGVNEQIQKMLTARVLAYQAKEENKEKGSLSQPEWIVGVVQASVLWGKYYDGADSITTLERLGQPMIDYWVNIFNRDVSNAFDNHPMRKEVITATSLKDKENEPLQKIILTSDSQPDFLIKFFIQSNSIYKGGFWGSIKEGYVEGNSKQEAMAHSLIWTDKLKEKLSEIKNLPDEISQFEIIQLFTNEIFKSREYENCHRDVYNKLTSIYEEWQKSNNSNQIFSLSSLTETQKKEINDLIPISLTTDVDKVVDPWIEEMRSKIETIQHSVVVPAIKNVLGRYDVKPSDDRARLEKTLINFLYINLTKKEVNSLDLKSVVEEMLQNENIFILQKGPITSLRKSVASLLDSDRKPRVTIASEDKILKYLSSTFREKFKASKTSNEIMSHKMPKAKVKEQNKKEEENKVNESEEMKENRKEERKVEDIEQVKEGQLGLYS